MLLIHWHKLDLIIGYSPVPRPSFPKSSQKVCVDVCTCTCTCFYVWIWMWLCHCAWVQVREPHWLLSLIFYFVSEMELLCFLLCLPGCLTHRFQGFSFCYPPPPTVGAVGSPHLALCGSVDLNSGPHNCMASTLPTEPSSPEPHTSLLNHQDPNKGHSLPLC